MTLISLTDCCRLLAIDGKTLRRWLAQAQLSAEAHPSDARIKGLRGEHLLLLARAHRRSLAALPEECAGPAATAQSEEPPLPPSLLDLLQTLTQLPAQLAALQQQLAELTQLVQQPPVTASHAHHGAGAVVEPPRAKAAA